MKKILSIFIFCAFIFSCQNIYAEEKKTVCLNMIVKNESHVIERCLNSIKKYFDYWVIVDTGSTDGTQDKIKAFLKDIPGELHQSDWVNFEYNRNEALNFAKGKGDYVLFIDADEQLVFNEGFSWPNLDKDYYFIVTDMGGMKYDRIGLINNKLNWKWIGVLHEYVYCPEANSHEELHGVRNMPTCDGARSKDPQKFVKDAQVLEKALEKEPDNVRYVFYLAQSYKDAGLLEQAIKNYERRVALGGGFYQEIFWAQYQIGILQERLGMAPEVFLKSYYKAFTLCPNRAESLNRIATYYRFANNFKKAYEIAKLASSIPRPDNSLFVEDWVYSYNLLLEYSIDAYWLGNYEESKEVCLKLLAKTDIPQNIRECVERNLGFANAMIYKNLMTSLNDVINSHVEELTQAEKSNSSADLAPLIHPVRK